MNKSREPDDTLIAVADPGGGGAQLTRPLDPLLDCETMGQFQKDLKTPKINCLLAKVLETPRQNDSRTFRSVQGWVNLTMFGRFSFTVPVRASFYHLPSTLCRKFSKFWLFLCISLNTDWVLQWWSMRKNILKHTQMNNIFDTKIILHNYILY